MNDSEPLTSKPRVGGNLQPAGHQVSVFDAAAFRATEIGPLPKSPKERTRIGEELQPVGNYAGIIPYLSTIQDAEVLQDHEKTDPEFISKDWWWDYTS